MHEGSLNDDDQGHAWPERLKASPHDGIGFSQARSDMAETTMYDQRISTPIRDVVGIHIPRTE